LGCLAWCSSKIAKESFNETNKYGARFSLGAETVDDLAFAKTAQKDSDKNHLVKISNIIYHYCHLIL